MAATSTAAGAVDGDGAAAVVAVGDAGVSEDGEAGDAAALGAACAAFAGPPKIAWSILSKIPMIGFLPF
jgi:hypothetical protein